MTRGNTKQILIGRRSKLLALLFLALLLPSCTTRPWNPGMITPDTLSPVQQKLVEGALSFVGAEKLQVEGASYRMDCSGVISAIYAYAGINLIAPLSNYTGNGVARLYKYLDAQGLLYRTKNPVPGDIIFWDNTWDANEDGRFNDPFTHTGMVVNRLPGGTVEYIHHNYRKGVVLERMNLYEPNTRTKVINGKTVRLNSAMRARTAPPAPGGISLASQLYRRFGMAYYLK